MERGILFREKMIHDIRRRYIAMKTRQAKDWWTLTFGDPMSWLILSMVGDWKWITPIGITILSLFVRITGAVTIALGEGESLIWGVFLIQLGVVMDHMDGNLARYRKITSLSGGFMDRIFDGVSFLAIISGLGWLAVRQGSPIILLLLAPMTGGFYLVICYIYWSYAYYELREIGESKKVSPGAIEADQSDIPTWKIIINGQKRILNFHHIDYYFWVSLSILIGKPAWGVWLLFTVLGVNVILRFIKRLLSIEKFD